MLYLHGQPEREVLEELSKHPLIFIDPVDPKRNVAAAVSTETFFRFVLACKRFLRNPSEKFFFEREREITAEKLKKILRKRDSRFYLLCFEKPEEHEDVVISQLRRMAKLLQRNLESREFSLIRVKEFSFERICGLIIEAEIWKLPKIMKRVGPEIKAKRHALEFLKHYSTKKAWIEEGKWVIEDERRFQSIREFLEHFFRGRESKLKQRGIPSKLARVAKTLKIFEGDEELIKAAEKSKELRVFLREYFEFDLNIEGENL